MGSSNLLLWALAFLERTRQPWPTPAAPQLRLSLLRLLSSRKKESPSTFILFTPTPPPGHPSARLPLSLLHKLPQQWDPLRRRAPLGCPTGTAKLHRRSGDSFVLSAEIINNGTIARRSRSLHRVDSAEIQNV